MTDLRAIERFRAFIGSLPSPGAFDVDARRAGMEAMARRFPPPDDIAHAPVTLAGVTCEWVAAPGSRDDHVVVWMHGGGFSVGSCATHRGLAGEVARHAAARVLTIEYRLSPEHPFPAGLNDCKAVYADVSAMADIHKLAVIGDSAGGALALGTMIWARDLGGRLPEVAALFSPWLDLRCTANACQTKASRDPMIHPDVLRRLASDYLNGHAADDPVASPALSDLNGLPPLLVQVGSEEVLLDDSLGLDHRARAAGADVTLEVWSEMVHVFQAYHMLLPDGQAALARTGRFFTEHWR
jgi:epsilon-lactone hydrolase